MTTHIDTAEVAKIIRKTLKQSWPAVKFQVHSKRYSGGSSIDVYWIDGPAESAVKAKIGQFQGADFDGMTDLKSYHNSQYNGESVSFGNDFLFTSRDYSEKFLTEVAADCAKEWGTPAPAVLVSSNRNAYIEDNGLNVSSSNDYYWYMRQVIMRAAAEQCA